MAQTSTNGQHRAARFGNGKPRDRESREKVKQEAKVSPNRGPTGRTPKKTGPEENPNLTPLGKRNPAIRKHSDGNLDGEAIEVNPSNGPPRSRKLKQEASEEVKSPSKIGSGKRKVIDSLAHPPEALQRKMMLDSARFLNKNANYANEPNPNRRSPAKKTLLGKRARMPPEDVIDTAVSKKLEDRSEGFKTTSKPSEEVQSCDMGEGRMESRKYVRPKTTRGVMQLVGKGKPKRGIDGKNRIKKELTQEPTQRTKYERQEKRVAVMTKKAQADLAFLGPGDQEDSDEEPMRVFPDRPTTKKRKPFSA